MQHFSRRFMNIYVCFYNIEADRLKSVFYYIVNTSSLWPFIE